MKTELEGDTWIYLRFVNIESILKLGHCSHFFEHVYNF